jgi:transcriptional regulator GlxA family with amidase domain
LFESNRLRPYTGEKIDPLLVAGGPNIPEASLDVSVIDWLREVTPTVRRYGSVCSGAFFLAKAGLLNGRRVALIGQ